MTHKFECLTDCLIRVIAITMVCTIGSNVHAEIKPKKEKKANTVAQASSKAVPSSLRCWQDGKLIFQKHELDQQNMDEMNTLLVLQSKSKAGNDKTYLFQMGSSTCLFENSLNLATQNNS